MLCDSYKSSSTTKLCPFGSCRQAIPVYMKYVSMVIIKPVLRCGEKIHEICFTNFTLDNQETIQEVKKRKKKNRKESLK